MKVTYNEYIRNYIKKIDKKDNKAKEATARRLCKEKKLTYVSENLLVEFNKDKTPKKYYDWNASNNNYSSHTFKGSCVVTRNCALYWWKQDYPSKAQIIQNGIESDTDSSESEEVQYSQDGPTFQDLIAAAGTTSAMADDSDEESEEL